MAEKSWDPVTWRAFLLPVSWGSSTCLEPFAGQFGGGMVNDHFNPSEEQLALWYIFPYNLRVQGIFLIYFFKF